MNIIYKSKIAKSWKYLPFALLSFFLFSSVCAVERDKLKLAPAGIKLLEEKLAAYPEFDSQKYEREAKKKYILFKKGAEVTLFYHNKQAKGKFYEITEKYIKIGSKKVSRIDLTRSEVSQFAPEVNAKMRQLYVKKQRAGYNAKKLLYEQKLIMSLQKGYPPISKKSFARVFRKFKDRKLAERYVGELMEQYNASLPIPDKVSKKQFLKKTLNNFLDKHDDIVLDGVFVISAERKHKEEMLKKLEDEARVKRAIERVAYPRTATPVFTPDGGEYDPTKTVTITSTTEGAEIHYTVNGKIPTKSSPIYKNPIKLTINQRLRAIAFHPEYNDSDCASMARWDENKRKKKVKYE